MTIHQDSEVELSASEFAFHDVDGVADAPSLSGLFGDELVSDHFIGKDSGFFGAASKFSLLVP